MNKLKPDAARLSKSAMKDLYFVASWQFVWHYGTHATGQLEECLKTRVEEFLHLAETGVKLGMGL